MGKTQKHRIISDFFIHRLKWKIHNFSTRKNKGKKYKSYPQKFFPHSTDPVERITGRN